MNALVSRLVAALVVAGLAAYFALEATEWSAQARVFPLLLSSIVAGLALIESALSVRALVAARRNVPGGTGTSGPATAGPARPAGPEDGAPATAEQADAGKLWVIIVVMLAFVAAIWLLGFRVGSALSTVVFLRFVARESLALGLKMALALYIALLLAFDLVLQVQLPGGAIAAMFGETALDAVVRDPIVTFLGRVLGLH